MRSAGEDEGGEGRWRREDVFRHRRRRCRPPGDHDEDEDADQEEDEDKILESILDPRSSIDLGSWILDLGLILDLRSSIDLHSSIQG